MGWLRSAFGLALGCAVAVGCADEDPTSVGGPLLPGGSVRTYELILDADDFLASDTTLSGFATPSLAGFRALAGDFDGLQANALVRFSPPPGAVLYTDTAGVARLDSMPTFLDGRVLVKIDTLRSQAAGPVRLELYELAEEWDPRSASWTLRVDSGQVQLPWAVPGGTAAALLDTATWDPDGADSVSFAIDSATAARWADTTDMTRGALIRVTTPDARLISPVTLLRLKARPSARPDTVVESTVGVIGGTFVADPIPPPGSALRVGGLPSWRSFLRFQRLDTLALPCPGEPAGSGCVLRLDEAKINYAALVLQPRAAPPGLAPEDSLRVDARAVLVAPSVPLERSPLGSLASVFASDAVEPSVFQAGATPGTIEVPLTRFVGILAAGDADDGTAPPSMLALYSGSEGGAFGLGSFDGIEGAAPPRLRLIVTIATQVEIR